MFLDISNNNSILKTFVIITKYKSLERGGVRENVN